MTVWCWPQDHNHHVSVYLQCGQAYFNSFITLLCGKSRLQTVVACVAALHTLTLRWTSHHLIFTAGSSAQPRNDALCLIFWWRFTGVQRFTRLPVMLSCQARRIDWKAHLPVSLIFCLSAIHRQEASGKPWAPLNETGPCVKLFSSVWGGPEGPCGAATAATLMHKRARGRCDWITVRESWPVTRPSQRRLV